ncbi:MAG: hypothetical protein HOI70_10540 [Opitutae bacterium]|mgnify:CR=1 FL=1|nr:hypothetical protein [Opitutae bacterium]
MEAFNTGRSLAIAKDCLGRLELDLDGLCVLTECASNAYAFTPVIAALGGAKVLAVGRNSKFGRFEENKFYAQQLLELSGATGSIEFFEDGLPDNKWREADIITNSGFLRPFTKEKVDKMNSRAVVCLMWETWEIREGEIDIKACQQRKIPVIGTNENYKDANMYSYPGMLCLKLLFEMGLEVANNSFVLLGEGLTGSLIAKTLRQIGIDFDWFVESVDKYQVQGPCKHYRELPSVLERNRIDAIICADHVSRKSPLGRSGFLDLVTLRKKFPAIRWAHLTGPVDSLELKESDMPFLPKNIQPVGFMTYESHVLGWEPVIMLNCAGLKVGELGARARKKKLSVEQSIKSAVDHGIGQDFEGGFMNFKLAEENQ